MSQTVLPIFPGDSTLVTDLVSFCQSEGMVTYFHGLFPVFTHAVDDEASFRMFTSQLVVTGRAKQMDIVRAFGVTKISVKRSVKKFRECGAEAFFERRSGGSQPRVLTPDVLRRAQQLLNEGQAVGAVAQELGIKHCTLRKAVWEGRLASGGKKAAEKTSCKSDRSVADGEAQMGMGCTRVLERVCSSLGLAGPTQTEFELAKDVVNGGVLWAIPALVENGLLRHSNSFELAAGFYGVVHVFVLLALMALARVRTVEQLRYEDPGEWGKLLGLDRIPEVRTLRAKLGHMAADAKRVGAWSSSLSVEWMEADCVASGTFYVDGHMRVYWGKQTPLPRRHTARLRLCLRGMMDYWVNDQQGLPFFVVQTPFSDGLLQTLEHEIVPRLLAEMPNQLTQQQLDADPLLSRFTLVFDREGYSPAFYRRMWDKRIACVTYHKFPKGTWEQWEFVEQEVVLAHGVKTRMKLAERGTRLSNGFWVREIRKLSDSGHQVSVLCTDYRSHVALAGGCMFSRWSQENYFKYMMENFDLDRLAGYKLEPADETRKVINPAYRQLEGKIKTKGGKLTRKRAEFGQLTLDDELQAQAVGKYETKKGELKEQIEELETQLEQLKKERKQTKKHLALAQLAEHEKFALLAPVRKQFLDTIRMIAYRAESAMAMILWDKLSRRDDARPLLREIYTTPADLIPDLNAKTLTIQLHHLTNRMSDDAVRCLADELNASETLYPGTELRMIFKLISDLAPGQQATRTP